MIGKKVIVRADRAGAFFGTLVKKENSEVTLKNARKLWYWAKAGAVEELAKTGDKNPDKCKFTVWVDEIIVLGVIQILPCTPKAIEVIEGVKEWKA